MDKECKQQTTAMETKDTNIAQQESERTGSKKTPQLAQTEEHKARAAANPEADPEAHKPKQRPQLNYPNLYKRFLKVAAS
ncbi:hypothetical protein DSO57_1034743 [Entomophthora muscae]|uniref:Uncharacterized protein n=1 Tax=Entomophthora muscae TaxID=34485 RepID=A0ACC2SP54_9FUNG|nr:hypothetical protein DSO57_1034743 [Entomophthora muscae]